MSYTPFKMTPKGPIMKKMLSASQKSKLPAELKKGMVDSGEYGGPLNKKGNTPYHYEKDVEEFKARKDKEAGKPKKSKMAIDGQDDSEYEYQEDMKNYKRSKMGPKNREDFEPAYPGADISKKEYEKRLKSGSTKRD